MFIHIKKGNGDTMKKTILFGFCGALAVCCFSGCNQVRKNIKEEDKQGATVIAGTDCEAVESEEGILSDSDIKKANEERKNEKQKRYAVYEPFGLTYDREKDLFFYEGETVRYFKDAISLSCINGFFYENGTVDLTGIRDTGGELTGLSKASKEEYEKRTERQAEEEEERESFMGQAAEAAGEEDAVGQGGAIEADMYRKEGISYDYMEECWMYGDRPIKFFYDAGHITLQDNAVSDGININVIRDQKGEVEKVVEITDSEMNKIFKIK